MGIKRNDKYFTALFLPPPVNHRKNLLAFLGGGGRNIERIGDFCGGFLVFQKGISAQEDI